MKWRGEVVFKVLRSFFFHVFDALKFGFPLRICAIVVTSDAILWASLFQVAVNIESRRALPFVAKAAVGTASQPFEN